MTFPDLHAPVPGGARLLDSGCASANKERARGCVAGRLEDLDIPGVKFFDPNFFVFIRRWSL